VCGISLRTPLLLSSPAALSSAVLCSARPAAVHCGCEDIIVLRAGCLEMLAAKGGGVRTGLRSGPWRLRRLIASLRVALFVVGFVSFVLCPRQRVASARGLLCIIISRCFVLCCALCLLQCACEDNGMVKDKDIVVLLHVLSCRVPRGRRTYKIKEQSSKGVDSMGRR
jgi:hypothetical protein